MLPPKPKSNPRTDDPRIRVSSDDLIGLRSRVRGLSLPARRPAGSVLAGVHGSRFRGRGMDYLESRHYQPGDDIRSLDWRLTARTVEPYTKVFQEERERPVVVLVDFGPSMFFASRGAFKSVQAARTAALVSWSAVARGDRIGGLLFNGGHRELSPTGGRRGVLRLIQALVDAGDPSHPARPAPGGLSHALQRLRRVARPGSLVYLISDFYDRDDLTGPGLALLRRHNDLVLVQVVDPLEQVPPPPGRYAVTDGKQRGLLDCFRRTNREAYSDFFARHHAAVRRLAGEHQLPLIQLGTEDDPIGVLRAALRPTILGAEQAA